MKSHPASPQYGLTVLEFTLAVLVIAVLIVFVADRVARVRQEVEMAAVEQSVARMRESLAVRFAELVVTGRIDELPQQLGINPLTGTRSLPPASQREPGTWYFDGTVGNVVYVPRYPGAIEWPAGAPRLLRWQVRPDWQDVDGDGAYRAGVDRVDGLTLKRLDRARWE